MPKKFKKGKSSPKARANRSFADHVVTESFGYLTNLSGASSYSFSVAPNQFNRAASIGDAFDLYRVKNLRFRLLPLSGSPEPDLAAIAYYPGVTDNPPTTAAQIAENPDSVVLSGNTFVPTRWCTVPKKQLTGYQPWYKTIVGTPDTACEVQGFIYLGVSSTQPIAVHIEAVMQFKGSVNTASTPQMRRDALCAKNKASLLAVLSYTGKETPSGPAPHVPMKRA